MISFSSEQWETVYVSFDDAGAVVIAQGKDRIIMDQEQWHKLLAAQQSEEPTIPDDAASDSLLRRRVEILSTLQEDPITKDEADELFSELDGVDKQLGIHPSDALNDKLGYGWRFVEEVRF